MSKKAIRILKENALKITQNRLDVLNLFLESDKAFSLLDLEKLFHSKHDRSSIFRSLQIYSEKGILEKFCNVSGTAIYALNHFQPNCTGNSHFRCKDCKTVESLPSLPEDYLELLGNKKLESMHLLIEGTCEKCLTNLPK
jgi:Fur family ferric uptake transcriptional regulator